MRFNTFKLEEVCELITDGSHSSPKAVTNGYKMLSVKDMEAFDFNYENAKQISEEDYIKLKKGNCQPIKNDVLIAKDGNSCLEYCFVFRENKPVVLLSSIAILRPNLDVINPYYLMYYLGMESTKKALRDGYLSGSAIPRVVLKDFKKFPLNIPNIEVQNRIVNLIRNINDKMENNNKLIGNLEQLSQTLFKHWFIDFEFPNEQGQPYKTSGGEMMESELGEIPKGWECLALYDLADYINGTSFKKNEIGNVADGLPIIKIAELKNGFSNNTKYFVGEKDKKYYLENGDILFSWSGNPYTSIDTFFWTKGQGVLNQHIFKVVSDKYPQQLIYTLLKYFKPEFSRIASNKQTTGLGHVTVKDLKNLKITLPKNTVQMKKLIALVDLILELNLENHKLVDIRDILLPKLLSGEIEIPDELVVD